MIFCTGDVISLIVQGLGGGVASAAFGKGKSPDKGGNIMLAGILFQMCAWRFSLARLSRVPHISRNPLHLSLELRFISLERRLTRSSVCLIVFTLCFIEYFVRYFIDKPVKSVE